MMNLLKKYYFLLPAVIFSVIYFPSIFYKSAWGDDSLVIAPQVESWNLMLRGFYDSRFMVGHHYIPFFYFLCFLVNLVFSDGAFPLGFHLFQYCSQILVCILVAKLVYKLSSDKFLSLLITSFWVIHPVNLQFMTRLLVGPGIASFILALLFFLLYIKAREVSSLGLGLIYSSLAGVCFLLCLMTGEAFIVYPVLLILFFYHLDGSKIFSFRYLVLLTPLIFSILVYFLFRYIGTNNAILESSGELITWTSIGTAKDMIFRALWLSPQLVVHYFKLMFYPFGLVDSAAEWYKVGNSLFDPYTIFCQIVTLGLIISSLVLFKKIPLFSIGIAWFFLNMILVLQVIPLFTIVGLRYCYFSSLGICLAVFGLCSYFKKYFNLKFFYLSLLVVFLLLMSRTIYYLPSSKDFLHQYIYCADEAPIWNKQIYIAKVLELANRENRTNELPCWLNNDNFEIAVKNWFVKYLDIKPGLGIKFGPMQMTYNYLVFRGAYLCVYNFGTQEQLRALFRTALNINNGWIGFYEMSRFLLTIGHWNESWEMLKKAIEKNPLQRDSYSLDFITVVLNSGKIDEAQKLLEDYMRILSHHAYPFLFSGFFYEKIGNPDRAVECYKLGIDKSKVASSDRSLYFRASRMFLKKKMYKESTEALNSILLFNPFDKKAKRELDKVQKMEKAYLRKGDQNT